MVPSLLIGRGGSQGFPKKNLYPIGPENDKHPMMTYPLRAAKECKEIDEGFFSSDCSTLKLIAEHLGAKIIDRPKELATDEALADDVFLHGYEHIKEYIEKKSLNFATGFNVDLREFQIEFILLLFANAPCISSGMLSEMISILRENKEADSICTMSKYNMFSPYRMRKLSGNQHCAYWENINWERVSCDRDSGEDSYIYDCSAAIVRPRCLENIKEGTPPQKWLGKRNFLGYKQKIPALDIDF
ncbi:hypothetical protein LCGC14_1046260, partial [marine sediment metagenome]